MARPFRRSVGPPSCGPVDARVRDSGPGHCRRRASEGVRRSRRRRRRGRSRSRTTRRCPLAIAFAMRGDGPTLLSARGATAVPLPEGTDGPPADAAVFPLAHQAVLRVALPLTSAAWSIGPHACRPSAQVAAGWRAVDERGERIDAPGTLPGDFALARAQLLLGVHDDPATELLTAAAQWRLSNDSSDLLSARDRGPCGPAGRGPGTEEAHGCRPRCAGRCPRHARRDRRPAGRRRHRPRRSIGSTRS